jgi:RND family efflux transporter MFP subunit
MLLWPPSSSRACAGARRRAAGRAGVAGLALLLAACGGGGETAAPDGKAGEAARAAPPADAVVVAVVAARPVNGGADVRGTGALRRERELELSFRIPGILRQINVREGDVVTRGALVASIDATQVDAAILQAQANAAQASAGISQAAEQARAAAAQVSAAEANAGRASADVARARAQLAQAEADLAQARADFSRDAALAERGFVSPARLESRQTRVDVAQATVAAARTGVTAAQAGAAAASSGVSQASAGAGAAVAGIRAATGRASAASAGVSAAAFDRGSSRLLAPADGVVLSRLAEPGEVTAPGQPVLVVADETSPLIVRLPLSDRDVAKVARGDPARVRVASLGLETTGEVIRVAERADPRTGAFDVDVRLTGAPEAVKTGFFAEVTLLGTAADLAPAGHQTVPAESLIEARDGVASLFVLMANRTTVRRAQVRFHGFRGEEAVVEGLRPGTLVVTTGGGFVSDGGQVRVAPAPAPGARR